MDDVNLALECEVEALKARLTELQVKEKRLDQWRANTGKGPKPRR